MNRKTFTTKFNKASDNLDKRKIKNIIKRKLNCNDKIDPQKDKFFMTCMEELSELSKEISKRGRGLSNRIELLEEMADVCLVIMSLQEACNIPTSDLYKAINVKTDRTENILNNYGYYK